MRIRVFFKQVVSNRYCQLIFYVTLLGFPPQAYNSDLIVTRQNATNIKTYYPRHLAELRKAVQPRIIYYVDSRNYKLYGKMLVRGVLFTYDAPQAKKVELVSDMDKFTRHELTRNNKGVWYYILQPPEYVTTKMHKKIRYKFLVDGIFDYDRTHQFYEEDNANSFISYFYLTEEDLHPQYGVSILPGKKGHSKEVIFRVFAPRARSVSLVGNFNQWNSEIDQMNLSDKGFFEIRKALAPGEYIYLFKVDGSMIQDKHNLELKYHPVFGRTSYLKLP